jgi:hypothetical protein
MTKDGSLEIIAILIVVILILFAIFREIILWYFKINERVRQLEEIKTYLWFIAESQNPHRFELFLDELKNISKVGGTNKSSVKSTLEEDIERAKRKFQ